MAILTVHQGHYQQRIEFQPPMRLSDILAQNDIQILQPCGGRGVCGKCAVLLSGTISQPSNAEARFGVRLACQSVISGDADAILPTMLPMQQIETGGAKTLRPVSPMQGTFGAAVDIGTTTLALLLYDLTTGTCVGSASMLNPQTAVAADVIGRIDAALRGHDRQLQSQIENAIAALITSACANAGLEPTSVSSMVVAGNTTMLYLLTGRGPTALARAPFTADCLFDTTAHLWGRNVYLPRCLHAFVGADTACALLAAGMTSRSETSLLCDIGTNGELALWHKGKLFITSTAAGPAFEGAGISCGCSSIPGAIDSVDIVGGQLSCHTIGNKAARGVCGSGLLDAVAALLDIEVLDETGYLEDEEFHLSNGVTLTQADIRAVQLAKAATYAGIISLLKAADCTLDEIQTLYIAGGFGTHLRIHSAVRIGLIPAPLAEKVKIIGNAALDGAAEMLLNTNARTVIEQIAHTAEHVSLAGNPAFADAYIDAMMFDQYG